MRQTISGLIAAMAVVTVSAAPALACGGGLFTSSCSPCGQAYVSPCGQAAYGGYYGYGGVAEYERLPVAMPQYYYVNQGPTYGGPGNFAPYPTYQETAVSGWRGYERGYDYGYDGGRYANPVNHIYDGAPAWNGPAVYSYRPRATYRTWRHRPTYGYGYRAAPRYSVRSSYRYGYARPAARYGYARPAVRNGYAPRYAYETRQRYTQPRVIYGAPHYRYNAPRYHHNRPISRLN